MSYGAATGDLDQDGDLDLIVANLNEPVSIYRNDTPAESRGLGIRLQGVRDNRFGIGAHVTLHTDTGVQHRQLNPYTGYLSSSEPIVHFGVGSAAVERITVDWPGGGRQEVDGRGLKPTLPRDAGRGLEPTLLTIVEDVGAKASVAVPADRNDVARQTMFQAATLPQGAEHREVPFDDFRLQPLLPNKLSQLGPGMAWGDVDGDGDDDWFLGGAAGSAGQIWIQDAPGRFRPSSQPSLEEI
jgi:hypothetical protein